MKNILSSLNESEKKRILEMHKNASNRHYLNEQTPDPAAPTTPAGPPAPGTPTPATATPTKRADSVKKVLMNTKFYYDSGKGVNVSFNFANGMGRLSAQNNSGSRGVIDYYCKKDIYLSNGNPYVWNINDNKYIGYNDSTGKPKLPSPINEFFSPLCAEYAKLNGFAGDNPTTKVGYIQSDMINQLSSLAEKINDPNNKSQYEGLAAAVKSGWAKPQICAFINSKQYLDPKFMAIGKEINSILSDINMYDGVQQNQIDGYSLGERGKLFCKSV
jgi:hypothetical protein